MSVQSFATSLSVLALDAGLAHAQGLQSATVLEFTDADTLFIVDSVAGMVLAGLATGFGAGLFPIVFGGAAETLPPELATMPTRLAHGNIATMLVALIALHVAAAIYHQVVLKDGLLRRIWFGNRSA